MNPSGSTLQVGGRERLWSQALAADSGIQVGSCCQCLRCTNSCPVGPFMDLKPHQVVRLVQLGEKEQVLQSSAIWICLSFEMCSTYCPNEIDVAALMGRLKISVVSSCKKPAERDIALFHRVFLEVLHAHGRMNDLQLLRRFKLESLLQGPCPARKTWPKTFPWPGNRGSAVASEFFPNGAEEPSRFARSSSSTVGREVLHKNDGLLPPAVPCNP